MKNKIYSKILLLAFIFLGTTNVFALPTCPTINRNLYPGYFGQDVKSLQTYLYSYFNYSNGYVTGYYGFTTKKLVQNFQRQQNISPVGAVGPLTRSAILNNCQNTSGDTALANCQIWYDGCNTCSRSYSGGPLMCTMLACFAHNTPYCKQYFTNTQNPVVCTADAKLCPNGQYVGRTGPNCEFVCPTN